MRTQKSIRRAQPRKTKKAETVSIFDREYTVRKDGTDASTWRIEIEDHLLTLNQFQALKKDAESRLVQLKNGTLPDREERALWLALDHLLSKHRPRSTAKDTILRAYGKLADATQAMMGLREYPFYNPGAAGDAGILALRGLHLQMHHAVEALRVLCTMMQEEGKGNLKLQDMIARREQFDAVLDPAKTLEEQLAKPIGKAPD